MVELRPENVGRTSILLAVTRDPELTPDCQTDNGGATSFALFSKGSNELTAISPGLYGSRAVPGTTMILNPRDRLRVRVPATVARLDPTHPLLEDPQRAVALPIQRLADG